VILRVLRAFDRLRQAARRRSWKAGHALGRQGEDYAHRLLQEQGYVVVARNYRLPDGRGEIDLVAWEGDTLVFVEVKSRQSDEFGLPERAIGTDKRLHLARAARRYARKAGIPWERVRFDVVSIIFDNPPRAELQRDAFRVRM
jgi:Predicted endonuclease distantly related to archaeal Holliday junction resolvase